VFESDFVAIGRWLIARALQQGVAKQTSTGAVVYETGKSEYAHMLLQSADGTLTQHTRYMASRYATGLHRPNTHVIEVMGDEWIHLVAPCDAIMRALVPQRSLIATRCAGHGMVSVADAIASSSRGDAILVDHLLATLKADARVKAWVSRCPAVGEDEIVTIVLMGCFLSWPTRSEACFTLDYLIDELRNPGWIFAGALVKSHEPRYDGAPAPALDDPHYRYLVRHAQLHRRLIWQAFDELDFFRCARHYATLSKWFLLRPPNEPLARVMRTVLAHGLTALGLSRRCIRPSTPANDV
jgi:hypothetical protein